MEVPIFSSVDLSQDEDEPCLTTDGRMEERFAEDSNMDATQRKECTGLPFQMFPDPLPVVLTPESSVHSLHHDREKERLPSIVVEHTDEHEVESGELRWPPEDADFEDDEDLFLEQCIPPANIADWAQDEEPCVVLNNQQNTSLLDLQSDAFRDDTPTLPPSSAPAFN